MRFKVFKQHGQAIGAFNREFVHTGAFPKSMAKSIAEIQKVRHRSDYDDFYVLSIQKTKQQLSDASEIVELIDGYIKEQTKEYIEKEKARRGYDGRHQAIS